MRKLAFAILGGVWLLAAWSRVSTAEARAVTITTTPARAAVFSTSKGVKKFLGYSPVSAEFEFPNLQATHTILVSKPGYGITKATIRSDSPDVRVSLTKRDLLAPKTSENQAVYDEVEQRLRALFYEDGQFETRSAVTGLMSLLPFENGYCLTLDVVLFEDSILKKLRGFQRAGRSNPKQAELAQEALAYCEDVLRAVAAKVGDLKQMLLIDLTVNYLLPHVDFEFDRQEQDRYSVTEFKSYGTDGSVTTTTISGWTYFVLDRTDISVRQTTSALKFIVPVDRVKEQGTIDASTLKEHVLVFQKEHAEDQFKPIDLKSSGK